MIPETFLTESGLPIKYADFERMAFDSSITEDLIIHYQRVLKFLVDMMPNREYREREIDDNGLLQLMENGRVVYSEVSNFIDLNPFKKSWN